MTKKTIIHYFNEVKSYYPDVKSLLADANACVPRPMLVPSIKKAETLIEAGCFRCYYSDIERFYEENGFVFQRKWSGSSLWVKYLDELSKVIDVLLRCKSYNIEQLFIELNKAGI